MSEMGGRVKCACERASQRANEEGRVQHNMYTYVK